MRFPLVAGLAGLGPEQSEWRRKEKKHVRAEQKAQRQEPCPTVEGPVAPMSQPSNRQNG